MKLKSIAEIVKAEIIAYDKGIDHEVKSAFGSDLMSDVLAYVEEDTLLITGLINHQVIRTAEMLDLRAILFVRGKKPGEEVIELAEEKQIILMVTHEPMFTVSGLLYQEGLRGIKI